MDHLTEYKIEGNLRYCQATLNNYILEEIPGRGGTSVKLEEYPILSICEKIRNSPDYMYILDLSDVEKISMEERNFQKLFGNKNMAIYFRSDTIEKHKRLVEKGTVSDYKDKKGCFVYGRGVQDELIRRMRELGRSDDIIGEIHRRIYMCFFLEDMHERSHGCDMGERKYLESSNVYVNRYINVKAFFLRRSYLYLLIDDMTKMINKEFPDQNNVCLLGVSNNGIILSRLLAYQIQIEAKSINHLGPKYSLNDNPRELKKLQKKKFILISDVICLGGEYRLAKGILDVMGSQLLGAVCVVKIKDVYRKEGKSHRNGRIYSLIDNINDIEIDEKRMGYQIYIDKEENGDGI